MKGQHWNNILSYIKLELGAKLNLLEMSDDEIIEALREHVLPNFSQYSEKKKEILLTANDIITVQPGQNQYTYKLPIGDEYVIDIHDVYFRPGEAYGTGAGDLDFTTQQDGYIGQLATASSDVEYGMSVVPESYIDLLGTNIFNDIQKSLSARNTWLFVEPDLIEFDMPISRCTVVCSILHDTLNTIRPDLYHSTFKVLCLGYIQRWIAALRSKYERLSTPVGEITINWQKLEQDSQTNIEKAMQNLQLLPPDHLIYIAV